MSSETEQYKANLQEEQRRRYEDRLDARRYILSRWQHFGHTEQERDEILEALGLRDDQLSKNLDWSEAQSLSRGGLGASMGKAVRPRTPPSRGQ